MKNLILISFTSLLLISCKEGNSAINPNGTYELNEGKEDLDGNYIGYSGEIKVKQIEDNKLVVNFYICKGHPSYNLGIFIDTLEYKNNVAIYRDKDLKKACTLELLFKKNGIKLKENANYEYGNCWGHGVYAHGFFKKTSIQIPNNKELLED
ncbi:MAG TPA: hypothetical protein VLB74_09185 [Flavobacterium sp.]|uniref:hypothetical protein n=1 Tax=Flavobacterium sp. TaxID=239 RepID=UPI002BB2EAFD|nr:hypothetical protein [Flavobacterium sp.]HSD14806.1 hypothetical protein [Flavobacterium sp.]